MDHAEGFRDYPRYPAYYHFVFTIPSELYSLVEANPKELLGLMFRASSDTLVRLCADPKWLGARPGIISVLHTAGQKLNYHPHIHAIITGGGLTPIREWPCQPAKWPFSDFYMRSLFA